MVFVTPDADRTLNTHLGVSSQMGPAQLEEEKIAQSSFVYLEGYLLSSDDGFDACCTAQRLAHEHGTKVSLTLSDPFMVESYKERFARLVREGVDLLFCNEAEAMAYCANADRNEACATLAVAVGNVCITLGAEGAMLAHGVSTCQVPGIEIEAVDTTGAGDMFAAGVLFGITHGFSLEDAGKLGSYAAALVVRRYGPRLDENLADKIDEILAHFG